MALDTFASRYSEFRAELAPAEQRWFDELLCRARRHSNAINRRPHLDFERPVMLSMLMEGMREVEELRDELDRARLQLDEACRALSEAGLVVRKAPQADARTLALVGQQRLEAVQ